ncbi:MAG TPA: DNA-directed RNA polymerase subunit beta', partial [Planctomycetaceae bacterium]|nr:DNA-directed RNA polymerase subunit beta' [Planctomycetaceae bacterium]
VGGLPRVTEILEARKPEEPAVLASISGIVRLGLDTEETPAGKGTKAKTSRALRPRPGKFPIRIVPVDEAGNPVGEAEVHWVPHGRRVLVHSGDFVRKGDRLVEGPLQPDDILEIAGEAEAQEYLLREVQQVYRSQSVEINDKHVEIIIAQMSRRVAITEPGDSQKLLPGQVVERVDFNREVKRLERCVKIVDPGDSEFAEGELVPRERVDVANEQLELSGKTPATVRDPKLPECAPRLYGISKAAVQSASFISAASFQETTKVLTEAALASKEDPLVGLKENVILGHLIPAGTGFRRFRDAELRFLPDAMRKLAALGGEVEEPSFRLLEEAPPSPEEASAGAPQDANPGDPPAES